MKGFLLVLCLAMQSVAWAGLPVNWSDDYDTHFRKYAKRYFGPNFDWRWFKAQAITESNLNPRAKSSAGALGIMQILPSTFADIQKNNPHYVDIQSAKWNIAAGIYYNRYLFRHKVLSDVPESDRLFFTFAGYNAGLGGAIKARKRAGPPADRWELVRPYAPTETRNYVERIKTFHSDL